MELDERFTGGPFSGSNTTTIKGNGSLEGMIPPSDDPLEAARIGARFAAQVVTLNNNVMPNLRVLLADVIGAVDASIPNKEQNRAVKHIIRTAFDRVYYDILTRAYPDANYGHVQTTLCIQNLTGPRRSSRPRSQNNLRGRSFCGRL